MLKQLSQPSHQPLPERHAGPTGFGRDQLLPRSDTEPRSVSDSKNPSTKCRSRAPSEMRGIRSYLCSRAGLVEGRLALGPYFHLIEDVPDGCGVFGGSVPSDGDQDMEVAVLVGEPDPVDGANVGPLIGVEAVVEDIVG